MASCPKCYALVPYGATVCPSCGASLVPLASAPPTAPSPASRSATSARRTSAGPPTPGDLPSTPTLPLFPGETIVVRFANSPAGQARVIRANGLIVVGLLAIFLIPFTIIIVTSGGQFNPILLIVFLPILLIGGMMGLGSNKVAHSRPRVVFLTDRRIIVERRDREASSAAIGLETLGDVQILQNSRGSRNSGVAWMYLLPTGTPQAMIGRGRARQAAPGVIWIPAVPMDVAQSMRTRILASARDLQIRLGYPTTIPASGH